MAERAGPRDDVKVLLRLVEQQGDGAAAKVGERRCPCAAPSQT